MSKEPVAFVRVSDLFNHLHDFGYEREQLLVKAGLTEEVLLSYEERGMVSAPVYSQLFFSATSLIPEEIRQNFWAGGFSGRAFHLTAYAMTTAHTLRQALQRVHDMHEMLHDRYPHVSISSAADKVRLTYTPARLSAIGGLAHEEINADRIVALAISAGLVHWYSFLSWMISQRIKLERVVFAYAPELILDHKNIMRVLKFRDIEHLSGDSYIEFSSRYLPSPIVVTPDSMDSYLDYSPSEAMPTLADSGTVVEHMQALIGQGFSNGFPSFKQLADRMDLSTSTLRRRLLAENSSYQTIKAEARKKLAIELLVTSELRIGDIAERSGFMNQTSFNRFFREWTKTTPQQYREQHR